MTDQSARTQQIHPAAFGALYEALSVIYHYKKDLEKFLRTRSARYPELVVGLDFDGYKRAFAEEFVDRLQAGEGKYRDLTLEIMIEVAEMDSFPKGCPVTPEWWHHDLHDRRPKGPYRVGGPAGSAPVSDMSRAPGVIRRHAGSNGSRLAPAWRYIGLRDSRLTTTCTPAPRIGRCGDTGRSPCQWGAAPCIRRTRSARAVGVPSTMCGMLGMFSTKFFGNCPPALVRS
ncbi:hypothetical protein ACFP3U_17770 [Kitasatospora misakiensis]|uniref:Uncharacterized protein n=1 Tax=Kitasatospora misakiensis TaxID=67330 RepID=A0ABW0X6M1_9ACTN